MAFKRSRGQPINQTDCINWAIFSLGTKQLLDVISFFLFNGGEGKTGDYGETRETTAALNYRPEKAVRPE